MKIKISAFLVSFLLLFSVFACSNPAVSRKPVSKITVNGKFKYNDQVKINVLVKVKNGILDSVKLYLDNHLVKSSDKTSLSYQINAIKSLGKHEIKVVARKKDKVTGVNFKSFEVISDINPDSYSYKIVKTYPHNTNNFTEGFEIHNNEFFESTGENGKSAIYKFDLTTGKFLKTIKLEKKYFGEGITIMNGKIYQLTYLAQKGFIYDLNNYSRVDSFTYTTPQGWGLTHNKQYIIKSDGSEFIHFLNPSSLKLEKKLAVYDNKGAVKNINELEYDKGCIYANIWMTNRIIKFDAETGKVLANIDLTGLIPVMHSKQIDVLNGIAINSQNGKMYVTGKLWPKIFEIKLVKKD